MHCFIITKKKYVLNLRILYPIKNVSIYLWSLNVYKSVVLKKVIVGDSDWLIVWPDHPSESHPEKEFSQR